MAEVGEQEFFDSDMNNDNNEEFGGDSIPSDYEYEDVLNTTQESNSSSAYLNQEANSEILDTKERENEDSQQDMLGLFLNFLRDNELNQTAEKLMEELKSSSK